MLSATAAFAFAARQPDTGKHCVWRVTNAKAPFYLVGSIHALSSRDYPLPAPYQEALNASQRFLFEINPNEQGFGEKLRKAAQYPKGQEIANRVHPKTLRFLDSSFVNSHRSYESFKKLKPWAIAFFVWGVRGYSDISLQYGVDHHLAYQASMRHKEVAGLESVDEHVEVLSGLTDLDGEILLLDAIIRGDKRRDDYNQVRDSWRHGDTAAIFASGARLRHEAWWVSQRLIERRNLKWIPRIEAELKTGRPTSIVAGAAHFCGPYSVVDLLRKRGYQIEQL